MAELTISAGFARGLIDLAVSRGASRSALVARAGIDPAALDDQDNRIPLATYQRLMHAGQELAGDPALALHFGEAFDIAELSILGLIGGGSETAGDALALVNRYGPLAIESEGERYRMIEAPEGVWIVDNRRNPNDFPEITESSFARMASSAQRMGQRALIRAVHVTHAAPPYRAEYERIFAAPVTFGSSRNAMLIDPAGLAIRIPPLNPYLSGVLSERAEALLGRLESAKGVRGQVEQALVPLLPAGEACMARVAAQLGLSRPTLARRLRAEGTSFESVLDALRHRLALDYLDRKESVSAAAHRLGFSDPAAFSRAFKRWTGSSPRAMRKPKP